MRVPFLDLRVTDEGERAELLSAVDAVLRHGRIVLGPETGEFEQRVAERVGRRFAIGVNSGTDALILSLRALGIGPGDEVIVPPLSFVATANTVALSGATPVFADLDDDLTLDPASVKPLITSRTRAIVPVHWAGKVCRMEEIVPLAEKHELFVIEDAAQAFDAERNGKKAGAFGTVGCFSMNCMKVFASVGEAGAVVTDDPALRDKLIQLRYHGLIDKETCGALSHNGRLDTIQAAMLIKRLDRLDAVIEARRMNAAYYTDRLSGLVATPREDNAGRDVYYTYQILTERRDELMAYLATRGIETKPGHLYLMPDQPVYRDGGKAVCANARKLHPRILCLPVSEKLTEAQREYVAESVREFFATRSPHA